jgi:hypothetical protein
MILVGAPVMIKVPDCHRLGVEVAETIFFSPFHCFKKFLWGNSSSDLWIIVGFILYAVLSHNIDISIFRKSLGV